MEIFTASLHLSALICKGLTVQGVNSELVRTFLDADLIPGVILWQSGSDVFVIDGAHRLSALIAWTHDDYGDGQKSLEFFGGHIPEEQRLIAERTRKHINADIGSYADYQAASRNLAVAREQLKRRVSRLATNSLIAQWVPAGDAKAAEDSFFKINQAATPIEATERRILKSRKSPNAVAARAIVKGGTGHKYWAQFPEKIQKEIETLGKEINIALYEPPISRGSITTLDLPVAGRGYNALPFVFDLVNHANGIKIADSTRKKDVEDVLPEDTNGSQTVTFLENVRHILDKITGDHPQSLGVHPVVYFYTRGGTFQPSAFLATSELLNSLEKDKKLKEFTRVRRDFEEFLVTYKEFMSQIVHKAGSGIRSIPKILALYEQILNLLLQGKDQAAILHSFRESPEFSYLSPEDKEDKDEVSDARKGKKFSRGVKSAAFLRDALRGVVRCPICEAPLHRNSIQFDHSTRRRDGGAAVLANAKPSHPFCNNTFKH